MPRRRSYWQLAARHRHNHGMSPLTAPDPERLGPLTAGSLVIGQLAAVSNNIPPLMPRFDAMNCKIDSSDHCDIE